MGSEFFTLLALILIILKATAVITLSWLAIFLIWMIPVGLFIVFFAVIIALAAFSGTKEEMK